MTFLSVDCDKYTTRTIDKMDFIDLQNACADKIKYGQFFNEVALRSVWKHYGKVFCTDVFLPGCTVFNNRQLTLFQDIKSSEPNTQGFECNTKNKR